jgi:hypothetical protein
MRHFEDGRSAMSCHEEQFDFVLLARQQLIEQLNDLCKSFQSPWGLEECEAAPR